MPRQVLDDPHIHPAIRETVLGHYRNVVDEVRAAVAADAVVIVGMKGNPFPKKARSLLDAAGIAYRYLEYGSYFSQWRLRNAIKMWCGWPTLPMIFVKGVLVGGYDDLRRLHESGEIKRMLEGGQDPGKRG